MRASPLLTRIRRKYRVVAPELDERRLWQWAAAEAREIGYGGVSVVARATGLARSTIHAGSKTSRQGPVAIWKWALKRIADDFDLTLTVCPFPLGTSKWNKVQHRLFSFISQTWCRRPWPVTKRSSISSPSRPPGPVSA